MVHVSTQGSLKNYLAQCEAAYWQHLLLRFRNLDQVARSARVSKAKLYRRAKAQITEFRAMQRKERESVESQVAVDFVAIERPKRNEPDPKPIVKDMSQPCTMLRFFGVECNRDELADMNKQQLEWLFNDARKAYLRLCKENHPDSGGHSARMAEINGAWARLRELMRKQGVGAD